jgi:maltoporin
MNTKFSSLSSRLLLAASACAIAPGIALGIAPGIALAQAQPAAAAQPATTPVPTTAPAAQPAPTEPPPVVEAAPAEPAPAPAAPVARTLDEQLIRSTVDSMPKAFEFHGYLRSGFGINSKGGELVAFQAPGAYSKYRLGNEAQTYGEALLQNNWLNGSDDGASFNTQIRIGFQNSGNSNYDGSVEFRIREAFAEAKNVIPSKPGLAFWAGNRFYDRHDVHITDFFFLDKSGLGGGFTDLKLGDGKLSAAFLAGAQDDGGMPDLDLGRRTKKTFDFRYKGIKLPDDSSLMAWGDLVFQSPVVAGEGTIFGFSAGLMHEKNLMGGFNKLTAMFGYGSGANFNTYLGPDSDEASHLRLVEMFVIQPSERLSMMGTAVFQRTDSGGDGSTVQTWISAGVRPVYAFTKYVSLATELGIDTANSDNSGDPDDGDYNTLAKLTIAPQITTGPTFWARPSIRAFATFAFWNEGSGIGGRVYNGDDTMGATFGLQAESWW